MENSRKKTKVMVQIALIAAIYTALTLAVAPLAYSIFQFRISEVLTVLPVFTPVAIPGLTLGCVLSNLIGFMSGANPIGWIDAIVGSIATLLATFLSYKCKNIENRVLRYALVPLPPVIVNAVIIGAELTFVFNGSFVASVFAVNFASVFVGQFVVCYILGIPLMMALENKGLAKRIFR